MAKCVKCEKKGLFLRVNQAGFCSDCAKAKYAAPAAESIAVSVDGVEVLPVSEPLVEDYQKAMEKQDRLTALMDDAEVKFKEDKDCEAIIKVYEEAFFDKGISMNSQSRIIRLSDLYLKNKMYDKNWQYLNYLTQECVSGNPYVSGILHKIRYQQFKTLKKEKRNFQDAIGFLMRSILLASQTNDPTYYFDTFGRKKFLKEAEPLRKKLEWSEQYIEYLASLIDAQVKENDFSEETLYARYRAFLEEIGSNA